MPASAEDACSAPIGRKSCIAARLVTPRTPAPPERSTCSAQRAHMALHDPVLLVDDRLISRVTLRDALAAAGITTVEAATAARARSLLASASFSVLLLDCSLPDGPGLALLEEPRAGATPALVVAIADMPTLAERLRWLRAGAADVVRRSRDAHFLARRLRELTDAPAARQRGDGAIPSRVLVVDDSATYRAAVATELARDGHDVVEAVDAAEALELLSVQRVEFSVIDVFMKRMDGIELARRMRERFSTDIPIMLLTGRGNGATKARAEEELVDDFLVKDRDLGAIRLRIRAKLGARLGKDHARQSTKPFSAATPPTLFHRAVAASGLSALTGRITLQRAIEREGVSVGTLSPRELLAALPEIERMLSIFLPESQLRGRVAAVRALAEPRALGREGAASPTACSSGTRATRPFFRARGSPAPGR